jgi:MATE family multidrug resistance protein
LLGLAWPLVMSRASQTVVGLGDALMVAHLGESALAATTTGALNTFSVLILPMGIVFIVSSFSSQLFGKGDLAGARRYGIYGLILSLATQLLCLPVIAATPWLLDVLPYAPDVRELMTGYLQIRLLSVGGAVAIEALGNYYGGLGNTRLPMAINIAAMVMDLFGNWVMIGGHLGFPAMGVNGAALSSTISTYLAAGAFFMVFLRDGRAAGKIFPRLHLRELGRMLRFGIPSGLNWFFEFFAFIFFINVVMAGLGTTALAALMAVMQVNSVSFMPAFGLASAGAILVGQAIGAGAKDQVPGIVRLTFLTVAVWQGAVGLTYLVAPRLLLTAFAGPEAAAFHQAGVRMLMLSAAWQLFDAAATTLGEALRAAGDTAFAMWARIAIAWAIFTPGSYISVRTLGGGDVAAVLWMIFYLGLLAGTLFLRFRGGAWRKFELTEPVPEI